MGSRQVWEQHNLERVRLMATAIAGTWGWAGWPMSMFWPWFVHVWAWLAWDNLECGGMALAGIWDGAGACLFCPASGLSPHCGELVRGVVGHAQGQKCEV